MTNEVYAKAKRHQDEIHDLIQIKTQLVDSIDEVLKQIRYENSRQGQFDNLELSLRQHVNEYFDGLIRNEEIEFKKV